MKLFEKNIKEVLDYLKLPLINNENELELIFGCTPYKIWNPNIQNKTYYTITKNTHYRLKIYYYICKFLKINPF